MAYYSTFIFQLPGCPEVHMTTRYGVLQVFWAGMKEAKNGKRLYKPPTHIYNGRVVIRLTKFHRRKIQTFMSIVFRYGNENIPRKWRKYVKNDGVFPQDFFP